MSGGAGPDAEAGSDMPIRGFESRPPRLAAHHGDGVWSPRPHGGGDRGRDSGGDISPIRAAPMKFPKPRMKRYGRPRRPCRRHIG